jgi:hypothetical protein
MNWYCSEFSKKRYVKLPEDFVVIHNINPIGVQNCNSFFAFWYLTTNDCSYQSFVSHCGRMLFTEDEFMDAYPDVTPIFI